MHTHIQHNHIALHLLSSVPNSTEKQKRDDSYNRTFLGQANKRNKDTGDKKHETQAKYITRILQSTSTLDVLPHAARTLLDLVKRRWNIDKKAPSISEPLDVVTDAQLKVFHHTVEQTLVHMKSDMPDPIPHLSQDIAANKEKRKNDKLLERGYPYFFTSRCETKKEQQNTQTGPYASDVVLENDAIQ